MTISLTKLRQQRAALVELAAEENEKTSDPTLSSAQQDQHAKEFDKIMKQIDDVDATITRQEKVERMLNGNEKPVGGHGSEREGNLSVRGSIIPANVRRHEAKNFANVELKGLGNAEERAYLFGSYLLATAARTCPGKYGHHSDHIQKHQDRFGPMQAATEGGNAGVFVPTEFGVDLISNMKRYGLARQLANVLPMMSDKRTDPKEGSDPEPTFVGEGVEGTDVTPTDDSTVTKTAKKLMAILVNSSELNEDAVTEFGDSMMRRLANGFAKKEDNCMWNGDASSTYGGMIGIRTKLQSIDGSGTDSAGLVTGSTGSGAAYSALTLSDFEEVVGTLPDLAEDVDEPASWVVHRFFYYTVMVRLELSAGGVTAEEIGNGRRRPIFLGYPVHFSNVMPKTVDTNQVCATFGDYKRAVDFGDRRMFTLSFSEHATVGSSNLWSSDQIGTKATERFDIQVHSVGDDSDAGPVVGLQTAAS